MFSDLPAPLFETRLHEAALGTIRELFGRVLTVDEVISELGDNGNNQLDRSDPIPLSLMSLRQIRGGSLLNPTGPSPCPA